MQAIVQGAATTDTHGGVGFVERDECPSCESPRGEIVWTGHFDDPPVREFLLRHHYAGDPLAVLEGERFRLVRCADCSLLFHARVLDTPGLTRLYGEWIDGAQIERFEEEHVRADPAAVTYAQGIALFKHMLRLRRLAGGPSRLRLLDFGCGDGHALRVAASLGFEAHGVDPSRTRSERAERACMHVHPTIADALESAAGPFDAVTMIEVLEHLPAPRATLESIAGALRPGGVLLVEVPDARSIARRAPATFDEMRVVHPLEHVNAFTPSTLGAIARAAGLMPVSTIPAYATTLPIDLVKAQLARVLKRNRTSRYFVKP